MGFLDSICDNVLEPLAGLIFDGIEATGRGIDCVVTTGIDIVGGGLEYAVDAIKENPGKTLLLATATIATGGAAALWAPALAVAPGAIVDRSTVFSSVGLTTLATATAAVETAILPSLLAGASAAGAKTTGGSRLGGESGETRLEVVKCVPYRVEFWPVAAPQKTPRERR